MYEITLLHVQLFTNIRGPCSLYLLSFVYILVRQYFIVLVNFAKKAVILTNKKENCFGEHRSVWPTLIWHFYLLHLYKNCTIMSSEYQGFLLIICQQLPPPPNILAFLLYSTTNTYTYSLI